MIKMTLGDEVIEFQPNTVQFDMGGPWMGGAEGFDFWLPKSDANRKLVAGWIKNGVDSVELELASGSVYTLTHPGTATADFDTYSGEILVHIKAGRG